MGRKEGGSLFYQLLQAPGLMLNATRERNGKAIDNSFQSQRNYRSWLHRAADFYKGLGIRRADEITPERIQQYADYLQEQGYTASTIHSYLAPVCKARGVPMDDIRKPIRTAAEYSKGSTSTDIPVKAGEGIPSTVALNAILGFRRSELLRLHSDDLHTTAGGKMYVVLDRGKGGKEQWQRVLPAHQELVRAAFSTPVKAGLIYHRQDMVNGYNYHGQRREMAQEALSYYSRRLASEPSYRKELYKEIADQWHRLNHRDRAKLEPLSYFDRPYCLRGSNKELAEKQGKAIVLDRLALRAVSVLHLSHWRDNITIQSYYFDR